MHYMHVCLCMQINIINVVYVVISCITVVINELMYLHLPCIRQLSHAPRARVNNT